MASPDNDKPCRYTYLVFRPHAIRLLKWVPEEDNQLDKGKGKIPDNFASYAFLSDFPGVQVIASPACD